jgi:hypothetical protein
MVVLSTTNLTNLTSNISKTKYFSIEIMCVDMQPNTQYDIYADGIKVNAFCKPFGGNLGDALIGGPDGKLLIQYHMQIQYNNRYLSINPDSDGYMQRNCQIQLVDPNGRSSYTYIPIRMKASSPS